MFFKKILMQVFYFTIFLAPLSNVNAMKFNETEKHKKNYIELIVVKNILDLETEQQALRSDNLRKLKEHELNENKKYALNERKLNERKLNESKINKTKNESQKRKPLSSTKPNQTFLKPSFGKQEPKNDETGETKKTHIQEIDSIIKEMDKILGRKDNQIDKVIKELNISPGELCELQKKVINLERLTTLKRGPLTDILNEIREEKMLQENAIIEENILREKLRQISIIDARKSKIKMTEKDLNAQVQAKLKAIEEEKVQAKLKAKVRAKLINGPITDEHKKEALTEVNDEKQIEIYWKSSSDDWDNSNGDSEDDLQFKMDDVNNNEIDDSEDDLQFKMYDMNDDEMDEL